MKRTETNQSSEKKKLNLRYSLQRFSTESDPLFVANSHIRHQNQGQKNYSTRTPTQ